MQCFQIQHEDWYYQMYIDYSGSYEHINENSWYNVTGLRFMFDSCKTFFAAAPGSENVWNLPATWWHASSMKQAVEVATFWDKGRTIWFFMGGCVGRIPQKISGKHFELKKNIVQEFRPFGRKKNRARLSSGNPYLPFGAFPLYASICQLFLEIPLETVYIILIINVSANVYCYFNNNIFCLSIFVYFLSFLIGCFWSMPLVRQRYLHAQIVII